MDGRQLWIPHGRTMVGSFGKLDGAIGLILGLFTPISLLVAIFLNLNYILLTGVRPKDTYLNAAYQCEQAQNWNMFIAQIVLLVLAGGSTWGLDSARGMMGA